MPRTKTPHTPAPADLDGLVAFMNDTEFWSKVPPLPARSEDDAEQPKAG